MTLNLVSPGVKVREVDLTVGRIDGINDQVGAIAGPFEKGPVDEPVLIETEADLLETFGAPKSTDAQYEYWMTASSFLSYGGILRVLRTNNATLSNANSPVGVAITNLSIKSSEDYYNNRSTDTSWMYAARNPGSWANGLKICTIDAKADQRIAIGTDGLVVGYAITAGFSTSIANTDGTVGVQTGYVKGIITDIGNGTIDVKVVAKHNVSTDVWSVADYEEGSSTNAFQAYDIGIYNEYFTQSASANQPNRYQIFNNAGTAQRIERTRFQAVIGIGSTVISFGEDLSCFLCYYLEITTFSLGKQCMNPLPVRIYIYFLVYSFSFYSLNSTGFTFIRIR